MTTTIIVEDGTLVAGANSYISQADLTAYASARNISLTNPTDVLLLQAMDYLETLDYAGQKWTYSQYLQWPRVNVFVDGWYQSISPLPRQLKNGLCETAIAIDQGNSPFQLIAPRVKREKVGDLEIEYEPGHNPTTIVPSIQAALYKLLNGASGAVIVRKA